MIDRTPARAETEHPTDKIRREAAEAAEKKKVKRLVAVTYSGQRFHLSEPDTIEAWRELVLGLVRQEADPDEIWIDAVTDLDRERAQIRYSQIAAVFEAKVRL